MELKIEIVISGVDDKITKEMKMDVLYNIKARLEGYTTTPPKGINLNNMIIRYKKSNDSSN